MIGRPIVPARPVVVHFRRRAFRRVSGTRGGRAIASVVGEIERLHIEAVDVLAGDWLDVLLGEPAFKVTRVKRYGANMIEFHGLRGRPGRRDVMHVTEICAPGQCVRVTRRFMRGQQ